MTDNWTPNRRGFQARTKPQALVVAAKKRLAQAHAALALLAPLDAGYADAINEYRDALEAMNSNT